MMGSDNFLAVLTAVVLFTSFVKLLTALSIVRFGVGLTGIEFGVACIIVSFVLAASVAPPEVLSGRTDIAAVDVAKSLTPYMRERIDPETARIFPVPENAGDDMRPLARAFVVSELKSAFSIGVMLLVPFVVTDLLVAHLLTLIGINTLSAAVVSLPLKLLLFVAVDGWTLIAKKLLGM